MMKNTIFLKYAVASLFMVSFSQSSWSTDEPDHDSPTGSPHVQANTLLPPLPHEAGDADAVVADVEDPVRLEKARRAVERAKKRLGLNEKLGRKTPKAAK